MRSQETSFISGSPVTKPSLQASHSPVDRTGAASPRRYETPASDVYSRGTHRAATEVGIDAGDLRLPETISQEELLRVVAELNADDSIDGVLVQLPLPEGLDEPSVIRAVAPVKDVDGFH